MSAYIGGWTEVTGLPDVATLARIEVEVEGDDYLGYVTAEDLAAAYREAIADELPGDVEFDGDDGFWGTSSAVEIRAVVHGVCLRELAQDCDVTARDRAIASWRGPDA